MKYVDGVRRGRCTRQACPGSRLPPTMCAEPRAEVCCEGIRCGIRVVTKANVWGVMLFEGSLLQWLGWSLARVIPLLRLIFTTIAFPNTSDFLLTRVSWLLGTRKDAMKIQSSQFFLLAKDGGTMTSGGGKGHRHRLSCDNGRASWFQNRRFR